MVNLSSIPMHIATPGPAFTKNKTKESTVKPNNPDMLPPTPAIPTRSNPEAIRQPVAKTPKTDHGLFLFF